MNSSLVPAKNGARSTTGKLAAPEILGGNFGRPVRRRADCEKTNDLSRLRRSRVIEKLNFK